MIKIYTVSDKRPDFIQLQYEGFKKFLKDKDYEFIICNNGSTSELRSEIETNCVRLGLKSVYVEGDYADGAIATQVPLIYCLKHYISKDDKSNISVIIDSDIFLFSPFSFEELLSPHDIAAIYQQRELLYKRFFIKNHFYLWNALIVFKNDSIKFEDFDISLIPGKTDVGGKTNVYIQKYRPDIKWISHTPDIEARERIIFNDELETEYRDNFGMQIIADSFIHYYRGSNWDASDPTYHQIKTTFLHSFLKFSQKSYPLKKDNLALFSNSISHTQKHFNGIRNNENLKFRKKNINMRLKWIL